MKVFVASEKDGKSDNIARQGNITLINDAETADVIFVDDFKVYDSRVVMASDGLKYGKGKFRLCEVQLADRVHTNPTAMEFLFKLINE